MDLITYNRRPRTTRERLPSVLQLEMMTTANNDSEPRADATGSEKMSKSGDIRKRVRDEVDMRLTNKNFSGREKGNAAADDLESEKRKSKAKIGLKVLVFKEVIPLIDVCLLKVAS